jgi:hypothetical protein
MLCPQTVDVNFHAFATSQLVRSALHTVHSDSLVILLCNPQSGEGSWHDAPRGLARHQIVFAEVGDAFMIAEKVLVQETLACDILGWSTKHCDNSIRVDLWLAKL